MRLETAPTVYVCAKLSKTVMKICLITPAPAYSRTGNRVAALRWAKLLRDLNHQVVLAQEYKAQSCDLMIALHARRSHVSMVRFRERHPNLPLILALVGTDLYGDIHTDSSAQESLELANRFVVLQPAAINELPERMASKARVIYQSVKPPPGTFTPKKNVFEVCVIGHMRPVKDPFRTALAARSLPSSSRIQVLHAGADLSGDMEETARRESALNPRYRWLGNLPHWKSMRLLARSRLLSLTSESEGGANVVSEAIACSVPVISSRISGSIGLLRDDYPGYFTVGDTQELAALLERAETDASFYNGLKSRGETLKPLFEPADERQRWDKLLREFY